MQRRSEVFLRFFSHYGVCFVCLLLFLVSLKKVFTHMETSTLRKEVFFKQRKGLSCVQSFLPLMPIKFFKLEIKKYNVKLDLDLRLAVRLSKSIFNYSILLRQGIELQPPASNANVLPLSYGHCYGFLLGTL